MHAIAKTFHADEETAYSVPARVVRLKSLVEVSRPTLHDDAQLQMALKAVAQASELMDRMQQRCTEIEREAEAYVYESRDQVTKARQQHALLEQRLRQAEERAQQFQAQCSDQALWIRELEVSSKEQLHHRDVAESALRARDQALCSYRRLSQIISTPA